MDIVSKLHTCNRGATAASLGIQPVPQIIESGRTTTLPRVDFTLTLELDSAALLVHTMGKFSDVEC